MRPLLRLLALLFALGLAAPALAQTPSASEAQVAWARAGADSPIASIRAKRRSRGRMGDLVVSGSQ